MGAILMDSNNIERHIHMFDWNTIEKEELSSMNSPDKINSLSNKKFWHLCYLFDLAYSLSMDPKKNMNASCGCEWQREMMG